MWYDIGFYHTEVGTFIWRWIDLFLSVFSFISYDALCMDKEGKRHVIRILQPGYETHWFSADSKDKADKWVEVRDSCDDSWIGSIGWNKISWD